MKRFRFLGVTLLLNLAAIGLAQAQPYGDALLLPPAPTVVTLSGTLDIHGGKIVLVLDQPVALQSTDRHSIDVASQSEIEVIGVAALVKDFHPKHVTVNGTLGRGVQGGALAVTVQRLQDTK
ncbi:MAG TPA: hypothetical protein VM621_13400 [Luteibacter sp.]|uniref:hypothetical protein n=1 Tax=Luteibacter sp. TaxID=1886636 RepID=UPI002D07F4BB|nr:hypothetical protein [Luteibacter sp.]HVI56033.1 hypothetical protein [Luteibacter sp.]